MTPTTSALGLIRKLGIDLLDDRYQAHTPIGNAYGGASFVGLDLKTNAKVFMKYLICPRGPLERAKFSMERDALSTVGGIFKDIVPKLLYHCDIPEIQAAAIVTEWVDGELLGSWLKRCGDLSIDERLEVFHRVTFAMSGGTLTHLHRDFHPGNIVLLPRENVLMGPVELWQVETPGVKILDWGEALPVISAAYDDEPEHNFTVRALGPRVIGGAIGSLPPEVFWPYVPNRYFGGTYEAWGLASLLYRILALKELEIPTSIGALAADVHNGSLNDRTRRRASELATLALPGGQIIPRLFERMSADVPEGRPQLSDINWVLWDVRYEGLSLAAGKVLDDYIVDPSSYRPDGGWKYRRDFDPN